MREWTGKDRLIQDTQYAFRRLRTSPGFTCVAVLILALGIGANTAIFSVVHAVLLRALPFHEPERVVMVWEKIPKRGADRVNLCAANFLDIAHENRSFEQIAAFTGGGFTLAGDSGPEQIIGARVSTSFFSVLGVAPRTGRGFVTEDEGPNGRDVVVLSDGLWRRRFGADPALLGKTIRLDEHPSVVIGIMPPGFQALFRDHELWTPLRLSPEERADRRAHYLMVAARLKPGITLQQAGIEAGTIGSRLEQAYPEANAGRGLRVAAVHDELVGNVRPTLLLLMSAVALVLLVACVNVANLLLARAASRQREIAVRAALGASRGRVLQQLVTEGLLLALIGAGAGLGVAEAILGVVASVIPATLPAPVPGLDHLTIDRPVLGFTVLATVLVSLVFGVLPAVQLLKTSSANALRERANTGGSGIKGYRLRGGLLTAEVAFSVLLLIGAGLLLRSLAKLRGVEPGFQSKHILTGLIVLPQRIYATDAQQIAFFQQVIERTRALPGVESAAAIDFLPLGGGAVSRRLAIDGRPAAQAGEEPSVGRRVVTPGYFETMGIALRKGRTFQSSDTTTSPSVVLVNETMARQYFPNENPIGQKLRLGLQGRLASASAREIVGIVADSRDSALQQPAAAQVYVPLTQQASSFFTLVVRAGTAEPMSLSSAMRNAVAAVDGNQPITHIELMTDILSDSVWQPRLNTFVVTAFAALALALALSGVYGVTSQMVGQSKPEIGIRMALGAGRHDVLLLFVRQGVAFVLLGVLSGLGLAVAVSRLISTSLYGVSGTDVATIVGAILFVVASTLAAMFVPAWRASRLDPMIVLRYE